MGFKVKFANDVTNAEEEARGSSGRLNVSSRQDGRAYYNSRDDELCFALAFNMTLADTGEHLVVWRNASPTLDLVISAVDVSVFEPVDIKVHVGTGTPAAGTELTPVNMNQSSSRAAPDDSVVMAMEGNASTPITGMTSAGVVAYVSIGVVQSGQRIDLDDRVRLGQNDSIFLEVEAASTPGFVLGTIYGYYE